MEIVPANATVAELEKKAAECEQRAEKESGAVAAQLRKHAQQYRAWIAALKSGRWIP